jgi:hypothetical protein
MKRKLWYVELWARTGRRAECGAQVDFTYLRKLIHIVRKGGNKFIVRIIEPLDVDAREMMELHSLGVVQI